MDALLMCGGRGSRLGPGEKPLRRVGGVPMVSRVAAALEDSHVERVFAVTSPNAPETASLVDGPRLETAGEGYVPDLRMALEDDRVSRPVVTVAADLPHLSGRAVDATIEGHDGRSLTVAVPVGRVRGLGFSVDGSFRHEGQCVRPAGLNVVGRETEVVRVTRNWRLAAHVNRPGDLQRARWLLAAHGSPA